MIQGKPPLTDSDYANVRRSVLQTIATRERRRTWTLRALQLGFATLAIAFVILWLVRTPTMTERLKPTTIAQLDNPATQQLSNPATPQPGNPATQQPDNPATEQPSNPLTQQPSNPTTQQPILAATQLSSTRHAAHVARRRSPHKATATLVASAVPLRIELATNDPDIRIIWITNPKESR
jgi:type IV secretory pathway VirB10-like protein